MFLLLLYPLPYLACFVLALLMPGRRSLAVLAVLLGLPLGWLVLQGFQSMARAPGGAILGAVVATTLICSAAAGLLSGVATRAVLLWFPRLGRSRLRSAPAVLLGLLALPSLLAASMWWGQHARRVPDAACLAATHHVRLAGVVLQLPSAPLFRVQTGENQRYAFSSHESMRAFCATSADAEEPLDIVHLSVKADELSFKGRPQRDAFCASAKQDWAELLCHAGRSTALSSHGFPEDLSVYSPTGYDHKRMLVSERGAYPTFARERDAALRSGHPLQAMQTGEFSAFSNGYWIARDGTWKNDAGEPYTLYCYETTPAGMLYCSTTYRLQAGPQASYRFRAHRDELAVVARTVDANFHRLMDSLAGRQLTRQASN